jgi:hypothetical protein
MNGRVIILDLLNGGPSFNISRIGCCGACSVCIVIVIVVVVIVAAMVVVVVGSVLGAAVVCVGGVVISPRWALAFFGAPFGPAVGPVMPHLVAVKTFNLAHIVPLLAIHSKGFI